jgi:hypothetical protein
MSVVGLETLVGVSRMGGGGLKMVKWGWWGLKRPLEC